MQPSTPVIPAYAGIHAACLSQSSPNHAIMDYGLGRNE